MKRNDPNEDLKVFFIRAIVLSVTNVLSLTTYCKCSSFVPTVPIVSGRFVSNPNGDLPLHFRARSFRTVPCKMKRPKGALIPNISGFPDTIGLLFTLRSDGIGAAAFGLNELGLLQPVHYAIDL
jgi:hypothetical protein